MQQKSRWPKFLFVALVLVGVIWLVAYNSDDIETFAEGVTGNQALGEKDRIQEEMLEISGDRNRQLEEVMGR